MSARKVQPPFLETGDTVGIVSPSWSIDPEKLTDAVSYLEGWGLKVRIGRNAANQSGPFAGTDSERLNDLQEMTDDTDIKAVLCSRGGYGLLRIIDKMDFSALKNDPKWYAGFSDITVLHNWLSEICGMASIHSDMPLNFNNISKTPDTFDTLRMSLFGKLGTTEWTGNKYRESRSEGEITGGNLSLVCSLVGTPAEPSTAGKILFLEDVGEYYYHIDRMMVSLRMAGKLEGLSALLIGGFNDINESAIAWGRSIEETIMDIVRDYDYPVFFDFPAGHISDNRAFYIGRKAVIEPAGNRSVLRFL